MDKRGSIWWLTCILWLSVGLTCVQGAPRLGRAVIAGLEGTATARLPNDEFRLEEGMALSHGHAIQTEKDSSVCALLTPGALLCIQANSRVELTDLQHVTQGLPGPGKPEIGRVSLYLERGAILVDAVGSEGLDLVVTRNPEVLVRASDARFIVARIAGGWRVIVERGRIQFGGPGEAREVEPGHTLAVSVRDGEYEAEVSAGIGGRRDYTFRICRELFPSLSPFAADWDWQGLDQVAGVLAGRSDIVMVTRPNEALDVSPTTRQQGLRAASIPSDRTLGGGDADGVRRRVEMWRWYHDAGTMRGVNYLPRTAVNSTEMWQDATFDPETIDEELSWAYNSGLNSVRVYLQYLVWQNNPDAFIKRLDRVLALAASHDLTVVPVLFDDYSPRGRDPYLGPQEPAVAGVYNSQWTPSPGHACVTDREAWPELDRYVKSVIGSFKSDSRILFWDLYSDAGRSDMGKKSLPLLYAAFDWAHSIRPSQPLTAGISAYLDGAANRSIMERSDIITFSGSNHLADLEALLATALLYGRPVICTGWLNRNRGMTFEQVLPMLSRQRVGWYHWGLVAGKSQLHVPEGGDSEAWQQAILKPDGHAYDADEIRAIREFEFQEF